MSHCSVYSCDCSATESHTVYSCTTCDAAQRSAGKKRSSTSGPLQLQSPSRLPPVVPKRNMETMNGSRGHQLHQPPATIMVGGGSAVSRRSASSVNIGRARGSSDGHSEAYSGGDGRSYIRGEAKEGGIIGQQQQQPRGGKGLVGLTSGSLADMMDEANDHARHQKKTTTVNDEKEVEGKQATRIVVGCNGTNNITGDPAPPAGGGARRPRRGVTSVGSGSVAASSLTGTGVSGGRRKEDCSASVISTSMGSNSVRRLEALKAELDQERKAKQHLQEQVSSLATMQDRLEGMLGLRDVGRSSSPLRRRSLAVGGKKDRPNQARGGGFGRQTPVMRVAGGDGMAVCVADENPKGAKTKHAVQKRTDLSYYKVLSPTTF